MAGHQFNGLSAQDRYEALMFSNAEDFRPDARGVRNPGRLANRKFEDLPLEYQRALTQED